jgi:opacity protein-like surface antigen
MQTKRSLIGIVCRAAAFSFFMAGTVTLAHAQIAARPAQSSGSTGSAPLLLASGAAPETLAAPSASAASSGSLFSSSTPSDSTDAVPSGRLNLSSSALAGAQPPPRRRYGRPNYADSHNNADGSSKYTFVAGAGFTMPTGGTHNYLTPSYKFQVGGGRNFNKMLGLLLQFDYDHFGFQTATLNNLITIYNAAPTYANFSQLGGSSHVWSFTLNPIVTIIDGERAGAYVTGGAGFYHKTANFTVPGTGEYCDPYYGCYTYSANETVDKYTSNAFGANGGFGFTFKPSQFSNERLFAEARYVWTDNQPRPYNISGTTAYYNAFPQNSARTTYIPVTIGIRF